MLTTLQYQLELKILLLVKFGLALENIVLRFAQRFNAGLFGTK
jgi:hypothetical protein